MNDEAKPKKRGRPKTKKTTKSTKKGGKTDRGGDEGTTEEKLDITTRDEPERKSDDGTQNDDSPKKQDKTSKPKTEKKSKKGKTTKPKTSKTKNGKKVNKTRSTDRVISPRIRVRTQEKHDEAIRYLLKRIYNSDSEEQKNKYTNMLNKLEKTTKVVG